MAISYRGCVASFMISSNSELKQNLFAIENGIASRVNVIVRRLALQNDPVVAQTVYMPQVKVSRITTAISGGMFLNKVPFDTEQSSDNAVLLRAAISSGTPITATEGITSWQQYSLRLHSVIQKVIADDKNLLPWLVGYAGNEFILKPGESLLVQIQVGLITSNPSITNNWFVQAVWEEESLGTFSIGGVVELNSVPVEGAKVIVMEAKDQVMTYPVLVEIKTTNAQGQWSSTIRSGCVGAAFVQHKDGATFYTAPGSPFLEE